MNAQIKLPNEDTVERRCDIWADWVNSDYLSGLGYPSATAEARTIFGKSKKKPKMKGLIQSKLDAMRWQANAKNSKCAKLSLPDWKIELAMDEIVNSLPLEFQRIIYARYRVRVKPEQLQPLNLNMRKLRLLGHDGRYSWPIYQKDCLAVLWDMHPMTFMRSLDWSHKGIIASKPYNSIR